MVLFSINELTLHSNFTLWFALSYNHLKIRLNFVYYAKNDIAEIDILKRYQRTVLIQTWHCIHFYFTIFQNNLYKIIHKLHKTRTQIYLD